VLQYRGLQQLNDAVSSVEWSGLPTTATYDGASKAKIAFYVSADCTGESKSFSTSLNHVQSLVDTGLNDLISAFMVLESSKDVENGEASLCTSESAIAGPDLNTTVAEGSEQVLWKAAHDA